MGRIEHFRGIFIWTEGAKLLFAKLKAELVDTMTMCGAHTLDEITEEKVYIDK